MIDNGGGAHPTAAENRELRQWGTRITRDVPANTCYTDGKLLALGNKKISDGDSRQCRREDGVYLLLGSISSPQ
ncbi:hypothetical protein ZWY2020_025714 [Hordeum vulgare]|nr:hypothetical protein ZWY2020_025714 [Hordeum vulgare]